MNAARCEIVTKAFNLLDSNCGGYVTVEDISKCYDVSQNADFIDGKQTREEILHSFLCGFEGLASNKDAVVTKQEFMDYYADISMSIENT